MEVNYSYNACFYFYNESCRNKPYIKTPDCINKRMTLLVMNPQKP